MPGLIGFVHKNSSNGKILEKMINSMKHEDFYKVDKFSNSSLGIARVHLNIFNPESQPFFNEDGSLCIFFDGKIYDYCDDMEKLEHKGYNFKFRNDAEYCLYSFEEYGINFVKNLNGLFVFVILDLKEEKIFICNDRYGFRPLYYYYDDKFIFASEIKAILNYYNFKKSLKYESVIDWFTFGGVFGDKTLFEGINVLPPASVLVYDNENLSIEQYWDFHYEPDYDKSEDELVDELISAFKKAVEIRMVDNYKYGISLSGGLDSRVVLAAIVANKGKEVLSFTFGPTNCDEVKIAKKVSEKSKTKNKIFNITPEMIIENAENTVFYSDGLNYLGVGFIPHIFKLMKEDINVDFDGFALDMTLGGSFLDKRLLNENEDAFTILFERSILFTDNELDELLINHHYGYNPKNFFKNEFDKINGNNANRSDIFVLKNRVRRFTAMGHVLSRTMLESTMPTFDNNFINSVCKIPPELRINHGIYRKFLMKLSPELARIPYDHTMVRSTAPLILWTLGKHYQVKKEELKALITKLSKEKIIFSNERSYINFRKWLQTNEKWKKFFTELLLKDDLVSKKYINQEYIRKLIIEHGEGKVDNSIKILYIASFEMFLRIFMEEDT
jgi:asparagine synthase (glutamine-hydrolysing)